MQVILCLSLSFLQKFLSYSLQYEHSFHGLAVGHPFEAPSVLSCICLHSNRRYVEIISLSECTFLYDICYKFSALGCIFIIFAHFLL